MRPGALLHNPTVERDACGIGFVADPSGRASREVVDLLLAGLTNVRHRGATAADRLTGDGAGVLLPLPEALRPEPGCGLAMVFLRDEGARDEIAAACREERLEPAGWRPVPGRARRARRRGSGELAADRAARAPEAAGPGRRRGRAARLPGPPPPRLRGWRLRRLAVLPDRDLQGALRGRSPGGLLFRPARPGPRRAVRHLPPALLDEHRPNLGARAAVPAPLPQRRDQRRARERQLDARSRRPARLRRPAAGRLPAGRVGLGLGAPRQRSGGRRPRRPRRAPRARHARPRVLGAEPGHAGGDPRLLPLPRGTGGAVGRACRDRLHGRTGRRRHARP